MLWLNQSKTNSYLYFFLNQPKKPNMHECGLDWDDIICHAQKFYDQSYYLISYTYITRPFCDLELAKNTRADVKNCCKQGNPY